MYTAQVLDFYKNLICECHVKTSSNLAVQVLGDEHHVLLAGLSEGKVTQLCQESSQIYIFEGYCVSELCSSGTVANTGWSQRRGGFLPSMAALICTLLPFSNLHNLSVPYSLKFAKAVNFAF